MKRDDGSPILATSVEPVEFGRWSFPDDADPVRTPEVGLAFTMVGHTYDTRIVAPLAVARLLLDQLQAALAAMEAES